MMQSSFKQKIFLTLAAILFLVRAVVPAGFMPDLQLLQRGVFKITICSAYGAQKILVDHDLKRIDQKSPQQKISAPDICSFSLAAGPALLAPDFILILMASFLILAFAFRQRSYSESWAILSRLPRGPPVLS